VLRNNRSQTTLAVALSVAVIFYWDLGPALGAEPPSKALTMLEALGQQLFFDTTLSTPEGQACASCHGPQVGFKFPNSQVNHDFGVATGAISTRVTNRSAPTIAYAAFVPNGPPHAQGLVARRRPRGEALFVGGLFLDGRAETLEAQARQPFVNPNEMNNLVHNVAEPALVVDKVMNGDHAQLFRQVYGEDVFSQPTDAVFTDIVQAIAEYERSSSSLLSRRNTMPISRGTAALTPEESDGLCLMTGSSTGRPSGPPFRKNTMHCATLSGTSVRRPPLIYGFFLRQPWRAENANNPFYAQTDPFENPVGYNALGEAFIDLGLGGFLYPLNNLPPGNMGPGSNGFGDYLAINGTFRVPTLRNVDKRPSENFVKAYMHNGVFKSLKEVVHFYNTRSLTTVPGEVTRSNARGPVCESEGDAAWPPPEGAVTGLN
jgi:cytochrome c peroxidase